LPFTDTETRLANINGGEFMISPVLANHLTDNREEVIRRWLDNLHGHIAEDFEQMLNTPMGAGVANKLLGCAIDFLGAEEYRQSEVLHGVRNIARDAAFRRAAVGFGLPDIVATALAFRAAIQDTMLHHYVRASDDDGRAIVEVLVALNRFGDVLVSGEIAGYFASQNYREADEDKEVA